MQTDVKPAADKPMTLALARKDNPNVVPGRRSFIKYTSLGVSDASNGEMRAEIMTAGPAAKEPTGWHYHVCKMQFLYMLEGSIDLQFADGEWITLSEGDSLMIPGGTVHQERGGAETGRLIEISVPAAMGTVNVAAPEGLA